MSNEQLFEYAREGGLIKLGQLVGNGVDLGATDSDGMTALMHAAASDNNKEAGLIYGKYDANIDAQDKTGKTALMYACAVGGYKTVGLLLGNDADATLTDDQGRTALDYAESSGNGKTLKLLRERS